MPEMASHIDTVAGAKYIITVCDVQSAYHQIPIRVFAKSIYMIKIGCLGELLPTFS